jgi:hypothetical protein
MNIPCFLSAQPWIRPVSDVDLMLFGVLPKGGGNAGFRGLQPDYSESSASSSETTKAVAGNVANSEASSANKDENRRSSSLDHPWAASLLGLHGSAHGAKQSDFETVCLLKNASCVLLDPTSRHVIKLSTGSTSSFENATGSAFPLGLSVESTTAVPGDSQSLCAPVDMYIITTTDSSASAGLLLKLGDYACLCDHTQMDSIVIRRRRHDPSASPALSLLWPSLELQVFAPKASAPSGAEGIAEADAIMRLFQDMIETMSKRLGSSKFEYNPIVKNCQKRSIQDVMTATLWSYERIFGAARDLLGIVDRRECQSVDVGMFPTESASSFSSDVKTLSRLAAEVVHHLHSSVVSVAEITALEADTERRRGEAASCLDRACREAVVSSSLPTAQHRETREDKVIHLHCFLLIDDSCLTSPPYFLSAGVWTPCWRWSRALRRRRQRAWR